MTTVTTTRADFLHCFACRLMTYVQNQPLYLVGIWASPFCFCARGVSAAPSLRVSCDHIQAVIYLLVLRRDGQL